MSKATCDSCGNAYTVGAYSDAYPDYQTDPTKIRIMWTTDPFAEAVHHDFTETWLCSNFAGRSYMDI